jgi:CDP-diacylglycerol pyrophosphatase
VNKCVSNWEMAHDPTPCADVEISNGVQQGYVIRKSENGIAEYWISPTVKIAGIESQILLQTDKENYWNDAWAARRYVFKTLNKQLPRDAIGLAVNSCFARSQDQLHIHVDCVAPKVRDEIKKHLDEIGTVWSPLPFELAGHRYRAMRVEGLDLNGVKPFLVLGTGLGKEADMKAETLVAIGIQDGFVLLDDHAAAETGDRGWGEELLDGSCSVRSLVP